MGVSKWLKTAYVYVNPHYGPLSTNHLREIEKWEKQTGGSDSHKYNQKRQYKIPTQNTLLTLVNKAER